MYYDFTCATCGYVVTMKHSMNEAAGVPMHCGVDMRRLYQGQPTAVVMLDMKDYIEKAYRGETTVPSLTTAKVRAIVDSQVTHNRRGRQTHARRRGTIVR